MKNRDNIAFHGVSSRENYTMDDLIGQLNQAIAARQEVTYRYREKNRCVQPYRLINHYGLWYLAAVDAGTLKAFELALISSLRRGQTASRPIHWCWRSWKQARVFALAKRQRCSYGFRLMRRSSSADARFFLLNAWWNGTTMAA
jgi:predicted DNA-binding transcriptional regulator YafY